MEAPISVGAFWATGFILILILFETKSSSSSSFQSDSELFSGTFTMGGARLIMITSIYKYIRCRLEIVSNFHSNDEDSSSSSNNNNNNALGAKLGPALGGFGLALRQCWRWQRPKTTRRELAHSSELAD